VLSGFRVNLSLTIWNTPMAGNILYFLHRHFRAVFAISVTLGVVLAFAMARAMLRLIGGI